MYLRAKLRGILKVPVDLTSSLRYADAGRAAIIIEVVTGQSRGQCLSEQVGRYQRELQKSRYRNGSDFFQIIGFNDFVNKH